MVITYKLLLNSTGVLKFINGVLAAFIPADPNNPDWVAYQAWAAANTVFPADPAPASSQDQLDIAAICAYQKLVTLSNMSPAQIQAWATANIVDLPSAREALTTLGIGMSFLIRQFIRGNK